MARTFDDTGLDEAAREIIQERKQALQPLLDEARRSTLPDVPHAEQSSVSGRAWDMYVAPATQLGLITQLTAQYVEHFWHLGLFDQQDTSKRHRITLCRPALALTLERIQCILSETPDLTQLIPAFQNQAICRSDDAARRVSYRLAVVERLAAEQVQAMVSAWMEDGDIGLLWHSCHPCWKELHALTCFVKQLQQDELVFDRALPGVRADLIALRVAFSDTELCRAYQHLHHKKAVLWDSSLLHMPAHCAERVQRRERLLPIIEAAISRVAGERGCGVDEAHMIITTISDAGLLELLCRRMDNTAASMAEDLAQQRLRIRATRQTRGLSDSMRDLALTRLQHLQQAIAETSTAFNLRPLIQTMPGSPRRRKAQRRKLSKNLIQAFAAAAGLTDSAAKSIIKNLMVYGVLGLLMKKEWQRAIDPRLWNNLHLLKIGLLDGVVDYARVMHQVVAYAAMLGIVVPTTHITRGVFGHFPKDAYYNSGDGEGTAGVPLRKALKLQGVARLHEQWLLLAVPLDIQLITSAQTPVAEPCQLVLVVDRGSQRPVDYVVSAATVDEAIIGQALYQALWHPQAPNWPLRGIPEQIAIPEELATGGLVAVRHAAAFLTARVTTIDVQKAIIGLPSI